MATGGRQWSKLESVADQTDRDGRGGEQRPVTKHDGGRSWSRRLNRRTETAAEGDSCRSGSRRLNRWTETATATEAVDTVERQRKMVNRGGDREEGDGKNYFRVRKEP